VNFRAARSAFDNSALHSVRDYDIARGQLHVEHNYPAEIPPTRNVKVDVSLVLELAKRDAFDTGSWVNVIGYVKVSASARNKRKRSDLPDTRSTPVIVVQAIVLWAAGSLRIGEYEKALERQKEARKKGSEMIASYG
jgi:Telomere capping, CST complex subunit